MRNLLELYDELHNVLSDENQSETFYQNIYGSVQAAVDQIPCAARVGIRCCGEHTRFLLRYIDFSHKNVVGIFDQSGREGDFYGYPVLGLEELSDQTCDYLILSSFLFRKEIREEPRKGNYQIVDIYKILEEKGYCLRAPFYRYRHQGHEVFHYFYNNYLDAGAQEFYEESLEKALLAAIEAKDFQYVLRLCRENKDRGLRFPFLDPVQEKTRLLLEWVYEEVKKRNQNDIFLFWTDAVSFDMLSCLPWLKERGESSLFFERAYAHTPYTHPTFRAMLSGLLPIDDYEKSCQKISEENSWVLRYLSQQGYEFKHIGFDGADYHSAEEEYLVNMDLNASCNEIFWESILHLLSADKPVFYMIHFMVETHPPIISPNQRELNYNANKSCSKQVAAAYRYMDNHLMLYSGLLGDKTQIFFSDHGNQLNYPAYKWMEEKLHAYFFVTGPHISKGTIKKFFPYNRFYYLVRWLIEPDQNEMESALAEYVVFQDVDTYSEALVGRAVATEALDTAFAYRGVIRYDCKYAINSIGKEFYYHLKDGKDLPAVLADSSEREYLRNLCGDHFLDIRNIEKFRYSRRLYEVYVKEKK